MSRVAEPGSSHDDVVPAAAAAASTPDSTSRAAEAYTVDEAALTDALRQVLDPDLGVNIIDLGLVYSINHSDGQVAILMTLTSPACPNGPQIMSDAKKSLEKLEDVDAAEIKLTMDPAWSPDRMTDEARDQLGIF
jgi:metal-sulfur cluster biosynthetic enzyme